MMDEATLRASIVDCGRRMNALGINQGRSGNVSARSDDGFLITPSAMAYETMQPADIVRVRADGSTEGVAAPSTEWRLHRDIYGARPEAGAIVHAHAMFATTLACLEQSIPAFHYMVAVAGGHDIRCAPYATFGTQALSDLAIRALEGRAACLHAQHGMTAFGPTVEATLGLAVEVETLAAMYFRALQLGQPRILSGAEMDEVLQKFSVYGQGKIRHTDMQ